MNPLRVPLLSAFLLTATAVPSAAQPHPFREGEPVPDLVLVSAEHGSPASLGHYRNQKLVLQVFASW